MTDRELMQLALEALELVADLTNHDDEVYAAIDALRERLAQPVQEPVAHVDHRIHGWPDCFVMEAEPPHTSPLYTTPPRREWVGLTDDEIAVICGECAASAHRTDDISFARAIEAKLKEKNA